MNAILLDTNIWLDYHLGIRPGHQEAFQLISLAIQQDIDLLIASQSLKDFWYLFWQSLKTAGKATMPIEDASRIAKHAAWSATEQIAEHTTVVGSDAADAWLALKMRSICDDYGDNLVVAAAMRAKPRLLVTNDQTLLSHCPVACATAADALAFLELN